MKSGTNNLSNLTTNFMKSNSKIKLVITCMGIFIFSFSAFGQDSKKSTADFENERNTNYSNQLENYLRLYLTDQYEERASKVWNRDYSSSDAFIRSVEPNRRRWESLVIKPPVLTKTGPLNKQPYVIEGVKGDWIELPLGPITAQAFLAFPEGANSQKPVPLIIVQHGIGSTPETPFRGGAYHEYAKELLKAGFAVLVPFNLRTINSRNRIERLCRLADISLPGIELVRVQNLLDVVLVDPRVDQERVGMWGVSLGGLATMFWMPIEPRIKAGIVSAWFNHRRNKMVIPDARYSCFLETTEDHAFFTGWLSEFTDSDVASLICPRPLQIQHGKKDRIAHWPQVIEEFDVSATHYKKLNIEDRIDLVIHEGGHEAIVKNGVMFLTKWLGQ
jgi:dienelactone hydrolase